LRYLFEEYAFDADRRELHRGDGVVSLAPQVFDLLYLLDLQQGARRQQRGTHHRHLEGARRDRRGANSPPESRAEHDW
jgi:hypothetical protein